MRRSIKFNQIIVAFLFSIILFSCKKDDGPELIDVSGLSIVNTSPSLESLDVYVDNTKVITSGDFTFGSKIDYLSAYSGDRRVSITKKNSGVVLKSDFFRLEPQFGYSLFIIDRLPEVKLLLLPDNLSKPPAGNASIRFANFSPDSEPLTLATSNSPNYLITNISFKDYSNPMFIPAGDKVSFQVREHRTGNLVINFTDVKLEEGKIYTIYVKGLRSATDATKFDIAMYTHK